MVVSGTRTDPTGSLLSFRRTKAVARRVVGIDFQLENIVAIPNALGVKHHAAIGDFAREVSPQAFHVFRTGLDGDHGLRARIERLARKHADVGAAVQHDIAAVHCRFARAINIARLLSEIVGDGPLALRGTQ